MERKNNQIEDEEIEEVEEEYVEDEEEIEETPEEKKARFLERLKAEPKKHRSIGSEEESQRHIRRALFRKDNQNAEDSRRADLLKAMGKVEKQQEEEEEK